MGADLMIQRVDSDVQCRVVPLHLLSLLHVHLHRTPLSRADARHAEYDQKHEESNADDGNHRNTCACHTHAWLEVASKAATGLWYEINRCQLFGSYGACISFSHKPVVFLPLRKCGALCGDEECRGAKLKVWVFTFASPNWQIVFKYW